MDINIFSICGIVFEIIAYLDKKELSNMMCINKFLCNVIGRSIIWNKFVRYKFNIKLHDISNSCFLLIPKEYHGEYYYQSYLNSLKLFEISLYDLITYSIEDLKLLKIITKTENLEKYIINIVKLRTFLFKFDTILLQNSMLQLNYSIPMIKFDKMCNYLPIPLYSLNGLTQNDKESLESLYDFYFCYKDGLVFDDFIIVERLEYLFKDYIEYFYQKNKYTINFTEIKNIMEYLECFKN